MGANEVTSTVTSAAADVTPDWQVQLYIVLGVLTLWARWRANGGVKLKPFLFRELVGLIPIGIKPRRLLEWLVFVAFGWAVANMTSPMNKPQAFAAGCGWIGFASALESSTTDRGSGRRLGSTGRGRGASREGDHA